MGSWWDGNSWQRGKSWQQGASWYAGTGGWHTMSDAAVQDQSLTVSVAASADDANETISNGSVSITGNQINVISTQIGAFRFLVPTLPQGATIVSAFLIGRTANSVSGSITSSIAAENADAAAQYTTGVNDITGRTYTTSIQWPDTAPGAGNQVMTSPDLKTIVQTVVDRVGFNGVLAFRLDYVTGTGFALAAFDHATIDPLTLDIVYS